MSYFIIAAQGVLYRFQKPPLEIGSPIIHDPRNPVVGTRLVREWDGAEHTVTVLRDGYEWQCRKFRSLSAVARAITGTNWNGFRFFGMREKKRDNRA